MAATLTFALSGGFAGLLALYAQRERLYFYPTLEVKTSPRHVGLSYQNVNIFYHTPPEVKVLHGWWVPSVHTSGKRYTILHCHGNAGNIGDRLDFLTFVQKFLPECNVLLFDYLGFGNSGSPLIRPTVGGCYESTRKAYDWLVYDQMVDPSTIIIWGESIGCNFATRLAANLVMHKPAGVMLQTPFTEMSAMVRHHYTPILGGLPSLFVRGELDIIPDLRKLNEKDIPVVMLHSPEDRVVPYSMAQVLRSFAVSFGDLSGGHNDSLIPDGENIAYLVHRFIENY